MNKKGLFGAILIFLIMVAGIITIYGILTGWLPVEGKTICDNKPSTLSCEEIQDCYDKCDEPVGTFFKMFDDQKNCRDKLKPYLWECLKE